MDITEKELIELLDTYRNIDTEVIKRQVESSETRIKALLHVQSDKNEQLLKDCLNELRSLKAIIDSNDEALSNALKSNLNVTKKIRDDQLYEYDNINKKDREIVTRLSNTERKLDQFRKASQNYWLDDSMMRIDNPYDGEEIFDVCIVGGVASYNYGGTLTLYATARLVEEIGYSVVIGDVPEASPGKSGKWDASNPTRQYLKKHLPLTKMLRTDQFPLLNKICRCVLYPSDSVWGKGYRNMVYRNRGVEFGEGIDEDISLISFSTSFGAFCPSEDDSIERRYISALLKRFVYISTREKEGVDILRRVFGTDADWTLDSVFFFDEKYWRNLYECSDDNNVFSSDQLGKEFIVAYILKPTEEKLGIIKRVSEFYGKPVFFIPDLDSKVEDLTEIVTRDFSVCHNLSMDEWLAMMDKADFVITDSYHGVCFSVIFEKQFIAFSPRDAANRIRNVTDFLGLSDRADVSDSDTAIMELKTDIDYAFVKEFLNGKVNNDRKKLSDSLMKATDRYNELVMKRRQDQMSEEDIRRYIRFNRILEELG